MKRIFTIVILLTVAATIAVGQKRGIHVFAHRGCWSRNVAKEFVIPENSVAAVAEARRRGYEGIELDVRKTTDDVMVILHDKTLNRTARKAEDYSRLETPVKLKNLSFEELRRDYVLESEDPALRTPIPTLEEILEECRKQWHNLPPHRPHPPLTQLEKDQDKTLINPSVFKFSQDESYK